MNESGNKEKKFWEEVRTLYGQIIDLPEEDRPGFISRHCSDKMVKRELELLLGMKETSIRFFESLEDNLRYPTVEEIFGQAPETGRVGNYSIIKKIGRGGMGTVYLAERADEVYETQVAVKILHHGLDSDDIVTRFHIERQILARLNHPNITHLHDGGVTSDGRPYFVMEYIEGLPITQWCNKHRRTCNQRLELFFQVCDALQYAHKNLVIHRDLKPQNILVTKEKQIKLLDFGIAEQLKDDATSAGVQTSTGLRLMTPEYASPEQIQGSPVNTTSDIYQLGLVLYELLCGEAAFTFTDRSLSQRERVILEEEPLPPSQRIAQIDRDHLEQICNARSSTPEKLKKTLKGDLDAIILKALNKEPDKRFASVANLKEDIDRYLGGLPVKSRGDHFGYKAGKYLRKNKKRIALVSGLCVILIVLGILYMQSITHERNIAIRESEKSEQVKDFMVDLVQALDPSEVRGEPISPTLLLDRGARRVLDSNNQAPEVRGELLLTLAEVYESLGLYEQSQEMLAALFEHLENVPGNWNLLEIRGKLHQAFLFGELGDYDKGQSLYLDIKSELEDHFPEEEALKAQLYSDYALSFRLTGDFETADSLLQISLQMHEKLYESGHPDRTRVQSRYATVLGEMGHHEEARLIQQSVLKADREHFGTVHRRVLRETNNLATTSIHLEKYEQADSLFTEAQELSQQLYGDKNLAFATILNNHGNVKSRLGHYEEAIAMFTEVLELRRESGVYDHPSTGFTTLSMSSSLIQLERYEEAQTWAETTIKLLGFGLPPQHWLYDFASIVLNKANFRLGRFTPDMLEAVQRSYENLKAARGTDDDYTQRALSLLSEIESRSKDQ